MSDHMDGPEDAAAGKPRMLEGPGGPLGKRRKHEESGVNPADASGTTPAPHPSAAKKPRKAPALCEHQRRRSQCKDCGGSGLCEHQRRRSRCKDCGGSDICEHGRLRPCFVCKLMATTDFSSLDSFDDKKFKPLALPSDSFDDKKFKPLALPSDDEGDETFTSVRIARSDGK